MSDADGTSIDDILAKVANGTVGEEELLDCAREALADPERLARLRDGWPTGDFPVVDDYYCVSCLGQGASGVVFKALSLRNQPEFVALKLLQYVSKDVEDRFREREIGILSALRCPHVARYLDSGTTGGTMYLVMELVGGQPLDRYLAEHAPTLEEKLVVFQRVCGVVAELHAEGVIHRDLKPSHVLVDEQGVPRVVDLGLSAVCTEDWPTRIARAQTELGHILGTVKYMSPEQAWGGLLQVDHRTDIWALGVMLYEIATNGDYPYQLGPIEDKTGPDALMHRIQTETPKKPRVPAARDPGALATLISRCLAHDPRHRISSADTLAQDLGLYLGRQSIRTRPLPLRYRLQRIAIGLATQRRMALWLCTVSAALVLLFLLPLALGVRWQASGEDYGKDTRGSLLPGNNEIAIVGVYDESITAVPELARQKGIPGVTEDIKSWRAVHGWLMERLATAPPRVVAWDYHFRTSQPGDAAFARGAQALWQAGVPIALVVSQYDDDGRPDLSPELYDPIADFAGTGVALFHDMVAREGDFIIAIARGDDVYPALSLTAFASAVHPDCRMSIDWPDSTEDLRLVHDPHGDSGELPTVDRVGLTWVYRNHRTKLGLCDGDVLGCKAFSIPRPEYWDERAIAYERLLTADDAELADLVAGKIIIVGDMRTRHPWQKRDLFPVRYGTEIVQDVHGCYLAASAVHGLLANRYLRSESPMTAPAFVGVAALAFIACLLPPGLSLRRPFRSRRVRIATLSGLLIAAGLCVPVLTLARSRAGVYAAMFSLTVCVALAASFAIEFARNRHRLRAMAQS